MKICSFTACDRKHYAKGYCFSHWFQLWKGNELKPLSRLALPRDQRFWDKVNKKGPTLRPELGPCWEWTAFRMPKGYGLFNEGPCKKIAAHRLSYELANGPFNRALQVCHRCDNPPCVNPAHLFLGSNADNQQDSKKKGRLRRLQGEQYPFRRLSDEAVREIRRAMPPAQGKQIRFNGASPGPKLAAKFGVSISTIYRIVNRTAWAHVA